MKTTLLRSGLLFALIVTLCSFTFRTNSATVKVAVLGSATVDGYTIYFDGPANYCGGMSSISIPTITDGTNYYTVNGKAGTLCYDSDAGKYFVEGKVKFYVGSELTEVFISQFLD